MPQKKLFFVQWLKISVILAWPRGYKTSVHSHTQIKAQ